MSRQRVITREQVLHKRREAEQRVKAALMQCLEARTGDEYEQALRDGLKAVEDVKTWDKVLPSL